MRYFFLSIIFILFYSCKKENDKIINLNSCSNSSFIDGSGNSYSTVTIGNKCWFSTNLKTKKFNNGDSIMYVVSGTQWQNSSVGSFCFYNNDSALGSVYGFLYNFATITDPRAICPIGSHVANDSDWIDLNSVINSNGGVLKEIGTTNWASPNIAASDLYNFSALGSGFRTYTGVFANLSLQGRWWCSDDSTFNTAFNYYIKNNDSLLIKDYDLKTSGFSIRCVAD